MSLSVSVKQQCICHGMNAEGTEQSICESQSWCNTVWRVFYHWISTQYSLLILTDRLLVNDMNGIFVTKKWIQSKTWFDLSMRFYVSQIDNFDVVVLIFKFYMHTSFWLGNSSPTYILVSHRCHVCDVLHHFTWLCRFTNIWIKWLNDLRNTWNQITMIGKMFVNSMFYYCSSSHIRSVRWLS
jgi:hypothetical protein